MNCFKELLRLTLSRNVQIRPRLYVMWRVEMTIAQEHLEWPLWAQLRLKYGFLTNADQLALPHRPPSSAPRAAQSSSSCPPFTCEAGCQDVCQSSCQGPYQRAFASSSPCKNSCEGRCEGSCESTCQTSCKGSYESVSQSAALM